MNTPWRRAATVLGAVVMALSGCRACTRDDGRQHSSGPEDPRVLALLESHADGLREVADATGRLLDRRSTMRSRDDPQAETLRVPSPALGTPLAAMTDVVEVGVRVSPFAKLLVRPLHGRSTAGFTSESVDADLVRDSDRIFVMCPSQYDDDESAVDLKLSRRADDVSVTATVRAKGTCPVRAVLTRFLIRHANPIGHLEQAGATSAMATLVSAGHARVARTRSLRLQIGALLAAIGACLTPGYAFATPTSKLTYVRASGAEDCPAETELRRAVAARVGYDPFFPWAERTAVAQIDPAGVKGFGAQVRFINAEGALLGERLLEPVHDCGELVQNIALAISVAIDDTDRTSVPAVAPTSSMVESEPEQEPKPERAVPTPSRNEIAAPPAKPKRWLARTSLGVVGTLGTAPSPAAGVVVGLGVRSSWVQIGLEGRLDAPASKTLGPRGSARSSLLLASLVPCAVAWRVVSPFACGIASIGRFEASAKTSSHLQPPRPAMGRWAGA